jgi:hypothetical protein
VLRVIFELAAEEVERGCSAFSRTQKKRGAEVGEKGEVERGRRRLGERDGVAGVRAERGLKIVRINAQGDFEFLGFGAEIGFGVAGANRVRVNGGRERRREDEPEKYRRVKGVAAQKKAREIQEFFYHGGVA